MSELFAALEAESIPRLNASYPILSSSPKSHHITSGINASLTNNSAQNQYTAAQYYRLAEHNGSKTLGNSWYVVTFSLSVKHSPVLLPEKKGRPSRFPIPSSLKKPCYSIIGKGPHGPIRRSCFIRITHKRNDWPSRFPQKPQFQPPLSWQQQQAVKEDRQLPPTQTQHQIRRAQKRKENWETRRERSSRPPILTLTLSLLIFSFRSRSLTSIKLTIWVSIFRIWKDKYNPKSKDTS